MGMVRYVALNDRVHSFRLFYDVHAQGKIASMPGHIHATRCVHTIQPRPYDQGASVRTNHII